MEFINPLLFRTLKDNEGFLATKKITFHHGFVVFYPLLCLFNFKTD